MVSLKTNTGNWFVLYTVPNFEKKVTAYLIRKSILTYLPLINVERSWSDRKKTIEKPLFPGYVFVKVARRDLWQASSVKGVIKVLSTGQYPSIIEEREIDIIKKAITYTPDVYPEGNFTKGEYIKIIAGPFAGVEGKIVDVKGSKRLFIYLQLLNQSLSINIQSDYLQKVNQHTAIQLAYPVRIL